MTKILPYTPNAIFFDLDGTLVDSLADLEAATMYMLAQLQRPSISSDDVHGWIGNGTPRLIKRALTHSMHAEPDAGLFAYAEHIFNMYYEKNLATHSLLYKEVSHTLKHLVKMNIPLACITNKATRFTLPLLAKLHIADYFKIVVCGDTISTKKPAPEPLRYAAKQCRVAIETCLMVGDSRHDIDAAKAATCPVIAVSYGYNHGDDIRLAKADRTIDCMSELLTLLA